MHVIYIFIYLFFLARTLETSPACPGSDKRLTPSKKSSDFKYEAQEFKIANMIFKIESNPNPNPDNDEV